MSNFKIGDKIVHKAFKHEGIIKEIRDNLFSLGKPGFGILITKKGIMDFKVGSTFYAFKESIELLEPKPILTII